MSGIERGRSARSAAQAEEDELNNRLFFRLFQAGNIYARQAQRELNVSSAQGAILGALSRDPDNGIPLSDLVEYLAVSRQNLDGVLKRLERLQYVERIEGAENRRIKVVRLTPAGVRAWSTLFEHSLEFYRQGTAGVPIEAKRSFVDTIGRINRSLKTVRIERAAEARAPRKAASRAVPAGGPRAVPSRGAATRGVARAAADGAKPAKRTVKRPAAASRGGASKKSTG